jgi:hypothetical protein
MKWGLIELDTAANSPLLRLPVHGEILVQDRPGFESWDFAKVPGQRALTRRSTCENLLLKFRE